MNANRRWLAGFLLFQLQQKETTTEFYYLEREARRLGRHCRCPVAAPLVPGCAMNINDVGG